MEQIIRALDLIAKLPATPALRREQIRLQVALIAPLFHVKGYSTPDAKDAVERAHLLIQQAEALATSGRRRTRDYNAPSSAQPVELVGDTDTLRSAAVFAVRGCRRRSWDGFSVGKLFVSL
jgi:hypothetical protein